MANTKEMIEFKSKLMSEVAKYIPEGMRDNDIVRSEFLEAAMDGIHRSMLTREEHEFVMKTKLYNRMVYTRSATKQTPKADRDWGLLSKKDRDDQAAWYEEQGGDARLDELESEYETMDPDQFCDPKELVLSLDYHLLGVFEPDHPAFQNGARFDFIIHVDEVNFTDIDFITDCRELILDYSHLFWERQMQKDARPPSKTKRSKALTARREWEQETENLATNLATLPSAEEITSLSEKISSMEEAHTKLVDKLSALEKTTTRLPSADKLISDLAPMSKHDIKQLAKNLRNSGWILFTMPNCPHSKHQLDDFGEFSHLINVIDAISIGSNLPSAVRDGSGFPCWYNMSTNNTFSGYKPLKALKHELQFV